MIDWLITEVSSLLFYESELVSIGTVTCNGKITSYVDSDSIIHNV